jgi:hypothetical protein
MGSVTNLILRGHVRRSFQDDGLYRLVRDISGRGPVKIFIHTWDTVQSRVSWRLMPDDPTPVDDSMVRRYFRDLSDNIESLAVESESSVQIVGRREGVVAMSWSPIDGYKRMFYGMMRAAEMARARCEPGDMVVQTRLDVLSNWASFAHDKVLNFLDDRPEDWEPIRFLIRPATSKKELEMRFDRWMRWGAEYEPHWTTGVDNMYMATSKDMLDFTRHMYTNLDAISDKYRHFVHQEWISMFEAFNPEWATP